MDTRPCSVCGGGDDEGTILACVECNQPFHDCIHCAGFVSGCDYGDWVCLDCSKQHSDEDEEGVTYAAHRGHPPPQARVFAHTLRIDLLCAAASE